MKDDSFELAGRVFKSRLIVGTGKYRDFAETKAAIEASGAEIVTVAVRRVNITELQQGKSARLYRAVALPDSAQHRRMLHGGGGRADLPARA